MKNIQECHFAPAVCGCDSAANRNHPILAEFLKHSVKGFFKSPREHAMMTTFFKNILNNWLIWAIAEKQK